MIDGANLLVELSGVIAKKPCQVLIDAEVSTYKTLLTTDICIHAAGSMYADVCRQQGFIGAHFGIDQDLTGFLGDDPREFNQQVRPIYHSVFPEKSKGSASLSCGYLYSLCKGIKVGDIVLSPNGEGRYLVGEVTGEYRYVAGDEQPHQRPVAWHEELVNRSVVVRGAVPSFAVLLGCSVRKL